jgi:hypothetical protein
MISSTLLFWYWIIIMNGLESNLLQRDRKAIKVLINFQLAGRDE